MTTSLQNIEAGINLGITAVPTHDSLIHLNVNSTISEFLPFSNSGEFLIEENSIIPEIQPDQKLHKAQSQGRPAKRQ